LTDPDSSDLVELTPVLCPTCELLVFPWASATADEDVDLEDDAARLRGLAQHWIWAELKRIYRGRSAPAGSCWWCSKLGRPLQMEAVANGEVEFANPVLCSACQGLLHMVGGGFANQDEAEREAQLEAERRVIAACRR